MSLCQRLLNVRNVPGKRLPALTADLRLLQYTMLSGQVPFQSELRRMPLSHVADIMRKIKEGDFSLEGEAWRGVSEEAKELVRGRSPRALWRPLPAPCRRHSPPAAFQVC